MSKKDKTIQYFFILGNNPALSVVEIKAVFRIGKEKSCGVIIFLCENFLIVELDEKIDVKKLMSVLGGTIKIGVIEKSFVPSNPPTPLVRGAFEMNADELISRLNIDKNKKFYFGFSCYGKFNKKINSKIKSLAMNVKKELKQKGVLSRWVSSKEDQLSSVVVEKNRLVGENGIEWCVLKSKDKTFLGKTLAVQDFEDYGKRDFERPKRDAKSGMLPPKLAKIMINLACCELNPVINDKITLLDPFCGSGTILQEAAILGIDKLIGSDLSEKAIADAKENLEWLESPQSSAGRLRRSGSYAPPQSPRGDCGAMALHSVDELQRGKKINIEFYQADVKNLSDLIFSVLSRATAPQSSVERLRRSKNSVDLIVAEPYLGPPLRGDESDKMIDKIIKELSELYLSAFKEFKKILKKGGVVCIVFPVFIIGENRSEINNKRFLPIFEDVKKNGFTPVCFNDLYDYWIDKKNLAQNFTARKTILYGRSGQKVWREIVVFKI